MIHLPSFSKPTAGQAYLRFKTIFGSIPLSFNHASMSSFQRVSFIKAPSSMPKPCPPVSYCTKRHGMSFALRAAYRRRLFSNLTTGSSWQARMYVGGIVEGICFSMEKRSLRSSLIFFPSRLFRDHLFAISSRIETTG